MSDKMKKIFWPGSTQLAPVPPVLVGVGGGTQVKNLLTVAWTGILCSQPPMVSVAIRPERFSYDLLRNSGEFSINLTTESMAKATDLCGVISGRDGDKFAAAGLTALPGQQISAPIVGESPLSLECKVTQEIPLGSHTLFLAEIVGIQVSEANLDASGRLDLEKDGLLSYVHGHYYGLGTCIGHFGFSVRKKSGPITRR